MKKNFDYLKDETLQKLAKYGMLSLFIKNQILDREMKKISLSEIEITEAKNLYKKSHKLESDEDFEHHKQIRFYTDESIRYNIELLGEAIQLASKGFRLFIVGSIEKTAALMTDVYYLFACEKKKIRDKRVKGVKDWFELESNLDLIGDLELVKSFRFVERYQLETPKLLRNIQQACVSEHSANIILTTGHKSKGRQWDCVRISKDFYDALKTGESEELNLLYVAITRASKHLDVPSYILKYVEKKQAQLPSQSLLQ